MLLYGILTCLAVGLIFKLAVDAFNSAGAGTRSSYGRARRAASVTWLEFGVATVLCAVIIVPSVVWAGNKVAVGNLVSYHENWGGFERHAYSKTIGCTEDGSCR